MPETELDVQKVLEEHQSVAALERLYTDASGDAETSFVSACHCLCPLI